jgi:pimeloyl-ACP methyl ester carboxylesterase
MTFEVDGHQVWCATGGRAFSADRPCIVFLHGAGCDHTTWTLPARWFAHHGWSVLSPDLPGHGRSTGTPLATVEAMARWTERLIDAAGARRSALVGHSMGGAIALETAARSAGRITHLGLIGTAAEIPVGKGLLDTAQGSPGAAYDMMTTWGHSPRQRLGGSPIPGLWMSGGTRRTFDQSRPGVLFADLAACAAWRGGREAVQRITCPSAVIVAAHDVMTPARRGIELAKLLPTAHLTHVPDAGHMLLTEAPQACLEALIQLSKRSA